MKILDSLFEQTVTGLNKAMDLSWRKGKVIASNIANAETPRYRATELDFGKELEMAFTSKEGNQLTRTDSKHMELARNEGAKTRADLSGITKADGNNVDIDKQMATMMSNSSDFSNAVQLMKYKFQLYRSSIRDGRG
jgi:flagellar basal-body rod protein FlgB